VGADAALTDGGIAVKDAGREGDAGKAVEATVIELLPNAAYRLELESREQVIAHATGATKANFVRVRPRDKVIVELSPHDKTRGRIVKLLR
jgi:translation initiation factor IF-1